MKKQVKLTVLLVFVAMFFLSGTHAFGQMKTFTWDTYKTKFKVPDDFVVAESTAEKWIGNNSNSSINLSIYPRKDENLSHREMDKAIHQWAVDNGVKNIGEMIELDETKINGYWGVLYEGDKDGNNVGTMLIVDPDYPNISFYIWVSYSDSNTDTVLEMLKSFTPN
jgi:hypothetical protein